MFDWVDFETDCPKCGAKVDGFQSKDGPCHLLTLQPSQVGNYYAACLKCNHWLEYDNANPPEPIIWCQSGGIVEEENTHVAIERSELEALRANDRRYRWLKEKAFSTWEDWPEGEYQFDAAFVSSEATLDAALDAELAKDAATPKD